MASSTITRITHDSPAEIHARLDDLLLEAFDLSLAGWRARGHWTADYTCHALVEDGEVLASAGVYRMEMLVRGEKQVWLQLGAVATRKARRGEGLSRRVLDDIFDHYSRRCPGAPFFLFANDSVLDFYPRFGFRRLRDQQPWLHDQQPWLPDFQPRLARRLDGPPPGAMRRLAVDDPAVGRYLQGRACFSALLDCANAAPLNWFHLLAEYADCIYEIPRLRTMLVARQRGDTLSLKDVVSLRPLTFAELAPCLGFRGVRAVRFGFNPDWLGVDYEMAATEEEDATPIFARGDLSLPDSVGWMLPLMIRT